MNNTIEPMIITKILQYKFHNKFVTISGLHCVRMRETAAPSCPPPQHNVLLSVQVCWTSLESGTFGDVRDRRFFALSPEHHPHQTARNTHTHTHAHALFFISCT